MAAAKPKKVEKPKRRPGRPRKGEERPKTPTRLERQADGMSLKAMLDDLPKACDRGTKKNARGILETWRGYKLHGDTADCGVPLSAILTSASVHDSQAAIPLATMTAERVVNLYDLMDAAYDATEIHAISQRLGHIPVIDTNPRRRQGPQAGPEPRGASPARRRPSRCPNRPIPHPHHRREDQCPAQGRVRRSPCPGARPYKGRLPSDVRSAGTDRRPDHPARRSIAPPEPGPPIRAVLPNGHGRKTLASKLATQTPRPLSGLAAPSKTPSTAQTMPKLPPLSLSQPILQEAHTLSIISIAISVSCRNGGDVLQTREFPLAREPCPGRDKVRVEGYNAIYDAGEQGRREQYRSLVNHYYDLVTDFYEFGWGQSFHFAPRRRGESFKASLLRHQHFLADRLAPEAGMQVLDVGCGVGGPMGNLARYSGAGFVGINNNTYQIERAKHHTRDVRSLCRFIHGDYMRIPEGDDCYDAAFAIESMPHAPDKAGAFREILRVLRPGACFAGYEWCLTDDFDPGNAEHQWIKNEIMVGDALPEIASHAGDLRRLAHGRVRASGSRGPRA